MQKEIKIILLTILITGIAGFFGNAIINYAQYKVNNPEQAIKQNHIDSLQTGDIKILKDCVIINTREHAIIKRQVEYNQTQQSTINTQILTYLKVISKDIKGLSKYDDLLKDQAQKNTNYEK